jgi:alpha-beta hydrolase superfamily lysophospholipase
VEALRSVEASRSTEAVSRRGVLATSAAAAGLVLATGAARAAPAAGAPAEYWASKTRDGEQIRLALYRRRPSGAHADHAPVLFLVHGSSLAALASFDLSVPGHGEYSLMRVFAGYGFDVWTMDHEGYGRSSRTSGNSDIESGVADLRAAMQVVTRETGQHAAHFMGESSGALRAGAFAMAAPAQVNRLVLTALTYTGKGSPTLGKRAEQAAYYRTHNRRKRDRAMIDSIFTRDKPGTTDPAVPAAIARAELVYGDSVPTGTYLDMTTRLPVLDPARIKAPVAVMRGEYDGIASMDDLWDFFRALPTGDKQFAVIPAAAHALATCRNRAAFWHVARGFLTMPTAPVV